MSVLERRLQILLDAARYERVADEAARTGRSVAAVIREAIDHRFPDDEGEARSTAAQVLLDITAEPSGRPEGPADFKEAYAEELRAKAGRA